MESGVQFFYNPLAHGVFVAHPDQTVDFDICLPFGERGGVNDAFATII